MSKQATRMRRKASSGGGRAAVCRSLRFEPLEPRMLLDAGPLVISEFMALNKSGLPDDFNEYSDWIEIHNPTPQPVVLDGWYLTDKSSELTQWRFPDPTVGDDLVLAAGDYRVVYASGRDRAILGSALHTNFALKGDGEYLALVQPDGVTIAHSYAPEFPGQLDNVSYGIYQSVPQYFTTPTPFAQNQPGALGLAAAPQFSAARGFYDAPFALTLSSTTPGATIRYTLDGSVPTATTGLVYSAPLAIATTSTVRAAAFKTGYLSSDVETHTYLFLDAVLDQTRPANYPTYRTTANGNIPLWYDMTSEIVDSPTYASRMLDSLRALPTLSLVLPFADYFGPNGIYMNPLESGTAWERETSAELILSDGSSAFQIDAGLNIQGNASRNPYNNPKQSMSLRFRSDYGAGKLEYPLFDGSPVDEFESLELRGGYNNTWLHWDQTQRSRGQLTHDQWARDAFRAMGYEDGGYGRYVHVYINGLYWGVFLVQERQEAAHYAAYHDVDDSQIDAINGGTAVDGDLTAWNRMKTVVAGGDWTAIQQVLDVDNFIDWTILQRFAGNQDLKVDGNWRAIGGGPNDVPWRFYFWDSERILESATNTNAPTPAADPTGLFALLQNIVEFRVRFADRLQKHLVAPGGALTPSVTAAVYSNLATELDVAIIAESARWGNYRRDIHQRNGTAYMYQRDTFWVAERDRLLNQYFPVRTTNILNRYRTDGWFPTVNSPTFSQHGGQAPLGFSLALSGTGTIYYTLDGSDPRLVGGSLSPTAIAYSGPITLTDSGLLRTRSRSGSTWSAVNEAMFYVGDPAVAGKVAITEINYNPSPPTAAEQAAGFTDAQQFEYVELRNIGATPLDLTGVQFTAGIGFDFSGAALHRLQPNDFLLVVRNVAAFTARYGSALPVAGVYSGALDNNGEPLTLTDRFGQTIVGLHYHPDGAWPGRADGKGSSLQVISTTGDYNSGDNWLSSVEYGGSPGSAGLATLRSVVINEVLTHTDPPLLDSVELHNTTAAAVSIAGWWLSDSSSNYTKYRIADDDPRAIIPAYGYVVFTETDFNPTPLTPGPNDFSFDGAHGDEVYFLEADASGNPLRFVDTAEFGAAANGESFGRWPDADGELVPMLTRTLGTANSGPRVGPLVISEVHYAPAAGFDEFIEIFHAGTTAVNLDHWQLIGGVDYAFPAGATLAPGQVLLVTALAPATFRAKYNVPAAVQIFGGYTGVLDNAGNRVRLFRPDEPPADEPTYYPLLLEDSIDYLPGDPWPGVPAGSNQALVRQTLVGWGNAAASWALAAPTPGVANYPASVAASGMFYNASVFDDPARGRNDATAVATGKTARLPGEPSTAAHYVNYSRGLNGIVLSVADLPVDTQLQSDDFAFRVGNTADLGAWTAGPAPIAIETLPREGLVRLTFAEGAIRDEWLEVTLRATPRTRLAADTALYFGSLVGDVTGDFVVDEADVAAIAAAVRPLQAAAISSAFDLNRDGRVNATDVLLARRNLGNVLAVLPSAPPQSLAMEAPVAALSAEPPAETSSPTIAASAALPQVGASSSAAANSWAQAWLWSWLAEDGAPFGSLTPKRRRVAGIETAVADLAAARVAPAVL